MTKNDEILYNLLGVLDYLESITRQDLSLVVEDRERREYRDDILQLSSTDIILLTYYYINANEIAKGQFLNLLSTVYNKSEMKRFLKELKNLYSLNKANLTTTVQFGASKRVVLDFINRLKDQALTEKSPDKKKEKELTDRLFTLQKLMRYFKSPSGSVEVRNIDRFTMMLNSLDINDNIYNDALYLVIQNNNKFYNNQITSSNLKEE